MEKQLDLCYGILIHKLSEKLKFAALKSLEENVSISVCSMISITIDKLGVNIVFDGYRPFYKAITKRVLVVNCNAYNIYPMVTDLTVIGAGQFLTETALKSFMSNVAPVLSVYLESDQRGSTTSNYRVIMNHPEIYDLIKLWPMMNLNFQIQGSNFQFPITFFCRLCRQNGHTRHQCPQISGLDEQRHKLTFLEKIQISHEDFERSPKQDKNYKKVESYEEMLQMPHHSNDVSDSKVRDGSIITEENKVSQRITYAKIKIEKSETNSTLLKHDVKKCKGMSRNSFSREDCDSFSLNNNPRDETLDEVQVIQPTKIKIEPPETKLNESIENKLTEKSLQPDEVKVLQPTLAKIKNETPEPNLLFLKSKDTYYSKRPITEQPNKNNSTDEENIEITYSGNKNNNSGSKVFNKLLSDTNIDLPKKVLPKRRTPKKCQKIRFSKLIPPGLHAIIPPLKKLFYDIGKDIFSEETYIKAKFYLGGINTLLRHLDNVVQFNLKEMSTNRTCQERRFIIWIDSLLNKIKEEHSKNKPDQNIIKIENTTNTKSESELNFDIDNLNNDKHVNNVLKNDPGMVKKNRTLFENIKKRIIRDKSLRNKDTLTTFKRNKGNGKGKCQNKNLESVIKNIKSIRKKNEPHFSGQGIFHEKNTANQNSKVSKNKKLCDMEDGGKKNGWCPGKNKNFQLQNIQKRYAVKKNSKGKKNTFPTLNMEDVQKNKIRYSTETYSVGNSVVYPEADMAAQKFQNSNDTKGIWEGKNNIYTPINMDIHKNKIVYANKVNKVESVPYPKVRKADYPKDPPSTTLLPTKSSNKVPKNVKVSSKLSPGLQAAIRCSKGVLKPSELKPFLIHVKGKVHVRQMAKNFSLEINKLIEQLEVIINKHYRGIKTLAPTYKEIEWIRGLIDRLKAHENCETCQL